LEALVDVGPDGFAVGALGLYAPEVAQRLHLPVLEEYLQVLFSCVELKEQTGSTIYSFFSIKNVSSISLSI